LSNLAEGCFAKHNNVRFFCVFHRTKKFSWGGIFGDKEPMNKYADTSTLLLVLRVSSLLLNLHFYKFSDHITFGCVLLSNRWPVPDLYWCGQSDAEGI
jgi:hypothetical protein